MKNESEITLTQFSKGSGCGCKVGPAVLEKLLKGSQTISDERLLVGISSRDDAAVYDAGNGNLIISTTDFFTPIVNNPFQFGQVAAANAISDVYAMGGTPLMALSVLGWPVEKISIELAAQVIEGAQSICKQAGIPLAGGHSIDIAEPVFGLCVTGLTSQGELKRNNTAKPGDVLFLTKPLGTGVLAAALKRKEINSAHESELIQQLIQLNTIGAKLGKIKEVTAMTDVTGFGLAGHTIEMTDAGRLTAVIKKSSIPKLNGFDEYTSRFIYPENTTRNFSAYSEMVSGMENLDFLLLCDPQTNGGLLFSVDYTHAEKVAKFLHDEQQPFWQIGEMKPYSDKGIEFI
jgi:selenide, water dikinase